MRRRLVVLAMAALLLALGYGAFHAVGLLGLLNPPAELAGLPLVEVPARTTPHRDTLVVLLSADGGWAALDVELAARLAAAGYSVVGWNSLRYYLRPRAPEDAAADLERVILHYTDAWHARRVVLAGYSFGADVLPFLLNRLPPEVRARVDAVVLLAPTTSAAFVVRPGGWFGRTYPTDRPTLPELRRLRGLPLLCIAGRDDGDSGCRHLRGVPARVYFVPARHGLGGAADAVSALVLGFLRG